LPRLYDRRVDYREYEAGDLPDIIGLCVAEGWPSFPEDPARAHRALTAPGVTSIVALDGDQMVGFTYLLSDGEIQAYIANITVAASHRRRGIARHLIETALQRAGGDRIDLITETADAFYESLHHKRSSGYRIYPPFTSETASGEVEEPQR
jgi:ribosomal protein S18 acetylase RimI-like enzyme